MDLRSWKFGIVATSLNFLMFLKSFLNNIFHCGRTHSSERGHCHLGIEEELCSDTCTPWPVLLFFSSASPVASDSLPTCSVEPWVLVTLLLRCFIIFQPTVHFLPDISILLIDAIITVFSYFSGLLSDVSGCFMQDVTPKHLHRQRFKN